MCTYVCGTGHGRRHLTDPTTATQPRNTNQVVPRPSISHNAPLIHRFPFLPQEDKPLYTASQARTCVYTHIHTDCPLHIYY